jgi:HEAT repeat protein
MKKRRRILLVTLASLLGVVTLYLALRPREPVHQGKRLSVWLRELKSWPGESSEPAAEAINEIGTNALPYLVSALRTEDSTLKVKLDKFLKRQRLVTFRLCLAEEKCDSAFKALLILRAKAANAIPEISRMFNQRNMTGIAGLALFAIGGSSLPALVEACSHTNHSVRVEAAVVLCKLRGQRGYTITRTIYPVGSTNLVSRLYIEIGEVDIAALATNLSDPLPAVRRASAEALGWQRGIAKPAVPGLLKALEDPDRDVRNAAAEALKSIDLNAAVKATAE